MPERVIVITGASKGIGAALAKAYASDKNTLYLLARNEQALNNMADTCLNLGAHQVETISLDLCDTEQVRNTLRRIDQTHPIDLLIANAGTTNSLGTQGEVEAWQDTLRVINTNLVGVLATAEPVIQSMLKRQQGQIALISSLGAYRGMPITPSYSASKAGVKAYGEALRGWLRHYNVRVSVIYPGFVKSAMSDQFMANKPFMLSTDQAAKRIVKGLEKNKAHIAFPILLAWPTRLLSILPAWFADPMMDFLGYGGKPPA